MHSSKPSLAFEGRTPRMNPDAEPRLELDPVLDFLRTIWALNHAIGRTSVRMESALGLTAQQRFVVRLVGKLPGVAPAKLAEILHVDRGSITAVLKRLESRGLIRRKPHAEDGRRVSLSLTASGRKLDGPTQTSVEHAVSTALARCSRSDVAAMSRVVAELVSALDEVSAAADEE